MRAERIGYGWPGLKRMKEGGKDWIWVDKIKRMKEGGEDWIWVDRIKENEGGRRGVDMGGQE